MVPDSTTQFPAICNWPRGLRFSSTQRHGRRSVPGATSADDERLHAVTQRRPDVTRWRHRARVQLLGAPPIVIGSGRRLTTRAWRQCPRTLRIDTVTGTHHTRNTPRRAAGMVRVVYKWMQIKTFQIAIHGTLTGALKIEVIMTLLKGIYDKTHTCYRWNCPGVAADKSENKVDTKIPFKYKVQRWQPCCVVKVCDVNVLRLCLQYDSATSCRWFKY